MGSVEDNARVIADIALQRFTEADERRVLIAVAGAPGSGKSTLAERAVDLINGDHADRAALFPMDGYHYDDAVLNAMGRRAFKGAIDTFDAHGLRHILQRLKDNADDVIAVPVFDRAIEIARAGGRLIPQSIGIIICEGNYLLSRLAPWDRLKPIFDATLFVDVEEQELRRRLQARWRSFGVDEKEVARRVDQNDLPNGLSIIATSQDVDVRLQNT